ncbi:MAG: hypothetical protein AMXMBFR13_48120 [Phycisphaerae bacterium]|jgi:hypothetical protein
MLIRSLGWLSAIGLLAGTAYAGNQACCGEVREIKDSRRIVGTPIARSNPCGTANPCGKTSACGTAKGCPPAACVTECAPKCKGADVDIEDLEAFNPECTTDLCVEYEIEIEDACPGDAFDLLVQITCNDMLIYERLVPLDQGVKDHGNEYIHKASFTDQLAQVYNTGNEKLKVTGNVFYRGGAISGQPVGKMDASGSLDKKTRTVRDDDRGGWAMSLYRITPMGWFSSR